MTGITLGKEPVEELRAIHPRSSFLYQSHTRRIFMEKAFRYDGQTAVVQTDKGLVHGYGYDGVVVFKGI